MSQKLCSLWVEVEAMGGSGGVCISGFGIVATRCKGFVQKMPGLFSGTLFLLAQNESSLPDVIQYVELNRRPTNFIFVLTTSFWQEIFCLAICEIEYLQAFQSSIPEYHLSLSNIFDVLEGPPMGFFTEVLQKFNAIK